MKVLYLASNSVGSATLRIEQDITELQSAVSQVSGDPVTFVFLPALPFEEIEQQLAIFKPDILHITAHGGPNELLLTNSKEISVPLSAESLRAVLSSHIPKLVYINACTSERIAESLAGFVPHAIGTSADITNFAARKSAVSFYRCLLRGQSLEVAYQTSDATVRTLDREVATKIFSRSGEDRTREFFYVVPKLVAHFDEHNFKPGSDGYSFNVGLGGASETTMQVVFCTDDESFAVKPNDLEGQLCFVVRTIAIRNEIWTEELWTGIYGDFRLYALGTTASGRCYSIASTLCEALTNFYKVYYDSPDPGGFPPELRAALDDLRNQDGSILRPAKRGHRKKQKPIKKKAKEND